MADLKFDDATFNQMKTVQDAVIQTLLPFKERTEGALVVFALIRCARVVLRLYPKKTQKELVEIVIAYLKGDAKQPGDESALIWTPPPSGMN